MSKPMECPYCGCEMRVEAYTYLGLWFRVVPTENHREGCFLRGVQHRRFSSEESAIASWNTRAEQMGVGECEMQYATEGMKRGWWVCSECGEASDTINACGGRTPPNYCGNCGKAVKR